MCRRLMKKTCRLVMQSVISGHRETEACQIRMEPGLYEAQEMPRERSMRRDAELQYRVEAVFECPSGDLGGYWRLVGEV